MWKNGTRPCPNSCDHLCDRQSRCSRSRHPSMREVEIGGMDPIAGACCNYRTIKPSSYLLTTPRWRVGKFLFPQCSASCPVIILQSFKMTVKYQQYLRFECPERYNLGTMLYVHLQSSRLNFGEEQIVKQEVNVVIDSSHSPPSSRSCMICLI
jgi:hypothetical protein